MSDYPVAENLYRQVGNKTEMLGCRCRECGEVFFPADLASCVACSETNMEHIVLGDQGRLWTWTIQNFMPKPPYRSDEHPDKFKPYGVGYVEFPAGVMVEGRIAVTSPSELQIGMPLTVKVEPLYTSEQGDRVMGFMFCPLPTGGAR